MIPTLFLILGWGYRPERVQAGIYLLFYTLLASLPLLVGILFIYNSLGSLYLFMLCGNSSLVGGLFYICTVLVFLVRLPIFMVLYDFLHNQFHERTSALQFTYIMIYVYNDDKGM